MKASVTLATVLNLVRWNLSTDFRVCSGLTAIFAVIVANPTESEASSPSVIVVLADDFGYGSAAVTAHQRT